MALDGAERQPDELGKYTNNDFLDSNIGCLMLPNF